MSDTYYSEFYPTPSSEGVIGTTMPSLTEGRVNAIIEDLELLLDDGVLSKDEKTRVLIPLDTELETTYQSSTGRAASFDMTFADLTTKRSAWLSYRNSLSPAWNNETLNTDIVRATFRSKINDYVSALAALESALFEESARRANIDGGLMDGVIQINREVVRTDLGIAAGIDEQSLWATYITYDPSDIAPRVINGIRSDGRINLTIPNDIRETSGIVSYDELQSFDGSDTVGFDPMTPTSPTESVGAVLRRYPIYPEQEGAIGDNIADDTAALQACLDSGRPVILTAGKTYKVTYGLVLSHNHQYFGGRGEIDAVGNFNILTVTGCFGAELDVCFHSPNHTGGWAVSIESADRTLIRRLYGRNVYGLLKVFHANVTSVKWAYGSCRGPGIRWHGNASFRSDCLILEEVWIGIFNNTNEVYALDIDGNCHTLETTIFAGVNSYGGDGTGRGRGVIFRNTSGGPPPIIARIKHLELDFIYGHGIEWTADAPAHDVDIVAAYIHNPHGGGTLGSCIKVGAMDRSGDLRIMGGYFGSFKRYAIENNTVHSIYCDTSMTILNDAGGIDKYYGDIRGHIPRLDFDNGYYAHVSAGNPILSFDANDYLLYGRSSNFLELVIGSTRRALVDTDGIQAAKMRIDSNFYSTLSGPAPIINFDSSDYISYDRTGNEYNFFVGGVKKLGITTDGISSSKVAIDLNFYSTLASSNPAINFDSSDYMSYSRAGNSLETVIGGVQKHLIDSDGAAASKFRIDTNFYSALASGHPAFNFDANDYLLYNRTNNSLVLSIGGVSAAVISSTAAVFPGTVQAVTGTFTGSISAVGGTFSSAIQVGNDINFVGTAGTNRRMLFKTSTFNRWGIYTDSSAESGSNLGSNFIIYRFDDAGAVIGPALTISRANGNATFSSVVTAGGFTTAGYVTGGLGLQVVANFILALSGSNPRMTFDSTDYCEYNRVGNYWEFMIGGAQKFAVDGTGAKAANFRVDDNGHFAISGTNVGLQFDSGDVLAYGRTTDTLSYYLGNAVKFEVTPSNFDVKTLFLRQTPKAVGDLPTAGTAGRRAFVNNANSNTFGALVIAGAPNHTVPVYDDGLDWRVG